MLTSTSMRWLVVAVSAAMLLAVAAACSSETIEVPGETVVVEKEVIKTVEVPGETVVKEVVKEVQVPGETVVVKEVVTETVEVPGETVVVEKEVVKTVEVPGETVTVEVVKEVMVPGETVVVEKEVVKTVEVPGETVVVKEEVVRTVEVPGPERVVVKEVPGKNYVTDPTTGKVVVAPEYGGTITLALSREWPGPDHVTQGGGAHNTAGVVVEKLGIADWATPRDEFSFNIYELQIPANTTGALAESWDISPDGLTYTFHIRQGVNWHNKAPMNGRELTAQDVEYNFHRLLGMGSGFTEKSPNASSFQGWDLESITATDRYTVVFELKEPRLGAMASILDDWAARIYPPEVIKEHGDVSDWRNLVGTGPFMLTDWTKDSSVTWDKNPDYWGTDEKYPGNRLPYVDQLRSLTMPEVATQLAALRTGKVDYIGSLGGSQLKTIDQVESLQQTNPDIVIWPFAFRNDNAYGMNVQIEPFDDIRVRKAMQMAINLEEIDRAYYRGYADTIPQGMLSRSSEAVIQFEDWPEDVKKVFTYDPEGAEALLDEAGYPRGADGVRFRTELMHLATDLNYAQLVASYWDKIGIEVEISVEEVAANWSARRASRDFEMMNTESAWWGDPLGPGTKRYIPSAHWNSSNVDDPFYTAKFEAAEAATTIEEQYRIVRELNQYGIEQFWSIYTPGAPQYNAVQPWIIGFNGENWLGNGQIMIVFTRLWIDHDLKTEMGY